MDHAAYIFKTLKMHKDPNCEMGVPFYMAIKDHKFAILGGCRKITIKYPENFWDDIKEHDAFTFQKMEI